MQGIYKKERVMTVQELASFIREHPGEFQITVSWEVKEKEEDDERDNEGAARY